MRVVFIYIDTRIHDPETANERGAGVGRAVRQIFEEQDQHKVGPVCRYFAHSLNQSLNHASLCLFWIFFKFNLLCLIVILTLWPTVTSW